MTEIQLTLKKPAQTIEALRYVAREYLDKVRAEGMVGPGVMYPIVQALADSIEEQVKPAVEEPTGDVVVFVLGSPYWPREGGVHWLTYEHSNNPPTWGELTDGVHSDGIQIYRRELPQSDDGAAAPPADYQGADNTSAAERANPTAAPSSANSEYSDLAYATRLDGTTMPAPMVVPNERCWCGSEVGARIPGDHLGLGCLANVTHNWTAASQESQDLIEAEEGSWREGYDRGTKNTRERIYNRQAALKTTLITSVEKSAIDKALAEIEKDADDAEGPVYPS